MIILNERCFSMKKIISVLFTLLIVFSMSACCISHEWTSATCTDPKTCAKCGKTEGEALGHTWIDATCTTAKTCSVCGETEGKPFGHKVDKWKTIEQPTCTKEGLQEGSCIRCGEKQESKIAVKDHSFGEWKTTNQSYETGKGTQTRKCSKCGKQETKTYNLTNDELAKLFKASCKSFNYKTVSRDPNAYIGEHYKCYGKVLQVCSEASSSLYYSTYRISTSGAYDNVVYAKIDNYGKSRLLVDDWITFYFTFDGLFTYETVSGSTLTIPQVIVEYYG